MEVKERLSNSSKSKEIKETQKKKTSKCKMWSECVIPFAFKNVVEDVPGGPAVKSLPANAGDTGSIPDLGRFHRTTGPQLLSP